MALLCGCAEDARDPIAPTTAMAFLTRDGCANTGTMRARLDNALQVLRRPVTYQVIDVDSLPSSDPRRGYGTPTILVNDRDLFGMPEQKTASPT